MFEFIRDSEFRRSLENDYKELNSALAHESWKSVQVLAGSIVESVLIDYLISINHNPDPLQMDLAKAVAACEKVGLLSRETAKLADVLRNFRNLIHPGRSVRLKEKVDENKASISKALVGMIVDSISQKLRTGEFTAEQIVKKIETDSSAMAIIDHLLESASEMEIERLLLTVLPEQYFELLFEATPETLAEFEKLFRVALEKAPWFTKQKVGRRFVEILKTENKSKLFTYSNAFFRGKDLLFIDPTERSLILKHLLWRLAESMPSREFLQSLSGVEGFLDTAQFTGLCQNLLYFVAYGPEKARSVPYLHLRAFLDDTKTFVGTESVANLAESSIRKRTQKHYDQTLNAIDLLRKLRSEPEITDEDIPF